ncbi:2-ketoacid reductase [Photobacterium jeanii]|uniref:2-ketoacid reductase n=1 Tax=Photobacterium jeanii TaxID=858640 RepID=A0A178KHG3_9GAMM|nr:D-2-hydroxyacid dehydrogenase [Photobacterium jeanii]OAN16671.1 2-ketoacid reductase [Photobacterium jeanii]PST87399.1 D-2-hydroxyacid dehydrogenase [Photobacterium jeanii]
MNKVLIVSRQHKVYRELLAQAALPDLEVTDDPHHANIILADPPRIADQLDCYPQLQWLQSTFAGVDALTTEQQRRDYQLTNVRGYFGQLISEYVLGFVIDRFRHISHYQQLNQAKQWQPQPYRALSKLTMVILGTGSIGSHLARSCRALGFKVVGVNRHGQMPDPAFHRCYRDQELEQALAQADVVVSTLPATTATDDILNATSLSHCQGALLFNVGRGNAVCEQGLLTAIDSGHIAHAYLDVFKQEPLPAEHPFWENEHITITPHIAAESFPEQVMTIFSHNYRRFHQQQPLDYVVDFEQGY